MTLVIKQQLEVENKYVQDQQITQCNGGRAGWLRSPGGLWWWHLFRDANRQQFFEFIKLIKQLVIEQLFQ